MVVLEAEPPQQLLPEQTAAEENVFSSSHPSLHHPRPLRVSVADLQLSLDGKRALPPPPAAVHGAEPPTRLPT